MIKTYDLSGSWDFAMDAAKKGITDKQFQNTEWHDTIPLPGTISLAKKGTPSDARETGFLTDPYLFEGYAWYAKNITLDKSDLSKEIVLYLERTRLTKIWIDDTFAGEYDSLNTPHQYDLTKYITKTSFRLTILVSNVDYPTKGGHLTSPDTQTNWNGIIGEIALHIYEPIHLTNIKVFPDTESKSADVAFDLVNHSGSDASVTLNAAAALTDINGDTGLQAPPASFSLKAPAGTTKQRITYSLGENAAFWSEYTPVVYRLELSVDGSGETSSVLFGLRKFSTNETEFLINGTPVFLRGKHDGLIFPLTGAVPTTVAEWIRVMKIAKSYGINHYRFHTCCPPEAAFTAADYLGIYMEPQLPFWGTLTAPGDKNHNEEEQQYLITEGYRMMDAFGSHASYCLMSLGNELWGSKERMAEIIRGYKAVDQRHLYTQGSNNFQHTPVLLPEDDFYVGVRFSKNRLIRGSYGMCDAPLGHIQWDEPSTMHNYDEEIFPTKTESADADAAEEIEIQYGTGVKKVKAAQAEGTLVPHIPVVSHEIGQFAVYPNFQEIDKYTGVLKARNFEVFRERLEEKGMLDQAEDFFYTSGKLSVQCYKEELEAAARTKRLAGYQILDIQDFTGQGTALVGILDAFMDSKGHVTPEEWSGFCSDGILLAQFASYIHTSGETFPADMAIRYYNPEPLTNKKLHWSVSAKDTCEDADDSGILTAAHAVAEGDVAIPDHAFGLVQLDTVEIPLPEEKEPKVYTLTLTVENTPMKNTYEFYSYPASRSSLPINAVSHINENGCHLFLTTDFDEADAMLRQGKRVLYLPEEVPESIEGFYCTDFWCYPMFRDICEWMKKPVAVGTMGLLIQREHPALSSFPTHKYATPQWYQIVSHSDCAILDDVTEKDYRPILQMVDNFDRNHKLGILFEGKAGNGSLMICTCRLSEISSRPEVKQFTKSLIAYLTSEQFAPQQTLDMDKLRKIFVQPS
ncbi:MAG: beta-glucuronidase [Clostridiaceae bacterium]|nr:beta-glucuronidase [Clostridiaceae bacterium]